jgi:hypothetical protein
VSDFSGLSGHHFVEYHQAMKLEQQLVDELSAYRQRRRLVGRLVFLSVALVVLMVLLMVRVDAAWWALGLVVPVPIVVAIVLVRRHDLGASRGVSLESRLATVEDAIDDMTFSPTEPGPDEGELP